MASEDHNDALDLESEESTTPTGTQKSRDFNTTDLKAALTQRIKNPDSNMAVYDRYYKLAIKEARKAKPRVAPNLTKKRPRSRSNSSASSDAMTPSVHPHDDWTAPKKYSKAGKAQSTTYIDTVSRHNRFTPLASQAVDAMLTGQHHQQHSTDGTQPTVPTAACQGPHPSSGDTQPANQAPLLRGKASTANPATVGSSQPAPPLTSRDANPMQPKASARSKPPSIYARDTRLDDFILLLKENNIDKKSLNVRQVEADNPTVRATDLTTYD